MDPQADENEEVPQPNWNMDPEEQVIVFNLITFFFVAKFFKVAVYCILLMIVLIYAITTFSLIVYY